MRNQTRLYCFFRQLLIFLYTLTSAALLPAQKEVLHFHVLSTVQNLTSGNYNYYLFKDQKGFVWVSSISGLNRYDGQRVKSYLSIEDDVHSLSDPNIQGEFFEDTTEALWFCTATAIHKYNRKDDIFDRYHVKNKDGQKFEKGYRLLYLDTLKNELWLKIQDEFYIKPIDTSKPTIKLGKYNLPNKSRIFRPSGTSSFYLFIPQKGLEIRKFDNNKQEIQDGTFPKHLLAEYNITSIFIENKNTIWLGSAKGLLKLSLEDYSVDVYPQFKGKDIGEVTAIVKIDGQRLLVGTKENGIYFFEMATLKNFVEKLCINKVFDVSYFDYPVEGMYLDKDQTLWIHSPGRGILFCNLKKQKFKSYLQNLENDTKLGTFVRSFTQDQEGKIYCLTREGVEVLNQNRGKLNPIYHIPNGYIDSKQPYPFAIFCDKWQQIWIGNSSGLYKLELDSIKKQIKQPTLTNRLNGPTGFTYFYQLSNDQLLAATTKLGVLEIEKSKPFKWSKILKDSTDSYTCIFEDRDRNIFICNETRSIQIYQLKHNQLIQDTTIYLKPFVTSILEDRKYSKIWVSTLQGLYFIKKGNSTFSIQRDSVLPDQTLNAMLQDSLGYLWISTNRGLVRYDPDSLKYQSYTISDGLQSLEFNFWSALQTKDKYFIFGGVNGINIFNPLDIKNIDVNAKPVITNIRINGKPPLRPLACELTGAHNISEIKKLKLFYKENNLTFDFAALEYSDPASTCFSYQMVGISDDFLNIENRNSIQFGALSPGHYVLKLKATNSDGVWSPNTVELKIVILPPWYETKLAFILYIALIGTLIYLYYRWRVRQIRKEEAFKRKETTYKQLVAETETAVLRLQMNPHFIFNSMNSISSYILQKDIDTANDYLNRFARLMRMILEFAEKPFLSVSEEIKLLELYLNTEAMRFEDKIDYKITVSEHLDPDEVILPTMILQPFIENAIWHGLAKKKGTKKISIGFELKDGQLCCSVEDNGVGRVAAAQQKTAPQAHESKAITITKRRLQLLEEKEGGATSLQIIDLLDEAGQAIGTKVLIRIPHL